MKTLIYSHVGLLENFHDFQDRKVELVMAFDIKFHKTY